MGFLDDILGQVLGKNTVDNAVPQGNLTKPIVMALLALLASGALTRKSEPSAPDGGSPQSGGLGGLLGGLLGGGRPGATTPGINPPGSGAGSSPGGLLGGGALAGGLLGGLGALLDQFQKSGQSETINSWIGSGQNRAISPGQLGSAIDPEIVRHLAEQTGLDRDEVLARLSEGLPGLVDQITPHGRMPSEADLSQNELSRLSEQLR